MKVCFSKWETPQPSWAQSPPHLSLGSCSNDSLQEVDKEQAVTLPLSSCPGFLWLAG